MSNNLKLLVDFNAYRSDSPTNNPLLEDSTTIKKTISESSFTELSRQQIKINASALNEAITLPDPACDYVLICVDQNLTMKMNGSSDSITLKPKTAGVKTFVFMNRGLISSMTVSNPSSTNAVNLDIIFVKL